MSNPDSERKQVYIVRSPHPSGDKALDDEYNISEILEIRFKLIEVLARGLKKPAYFQDGLHASLSKWFTELPEAFEVLKSAFPEPEDALQNRDQIEQLYDKVIIENKEEFADCAMYEIYLLDKLRVISALCGNEIDMKVTEPNNFMTMHRDQRDDIVCRNIRKYGNRDNILFMGSAHRLNKLMDASDMDIFTVTISQIKFDGAYNVYTKLPKRFESSIAEAFRVFRLSAVELPQYV